MLLLKRVIHLLFRAINASDPAMYSVFKHLRDTLLAMELQSHHPNAARILPALKPLIQLGTARAPIAILSMPELYAPSEKLIVATNLKSSLLRQDKARWIKK
jgi:hypothetical protein